MDLTYAQKLERLLQVGLEIAEVKDVDLLLEKILTEARAIVAADAGSIYVREGDDVLRFSHAQNETLRARLGPGKTLPFEPFTLPIDPNSIAGYVATTGEPLNVPDVHAIPAGAPYHFQPRFDEISNYRTCAALTLPLLDARRLVIGVLQVINPAGPPGAPPGFTAEDELICRHFANHAAVALERARMTRATVMRMIRMAELRDPYETGPHAGRVAAYAAEIFRAWAAAAGLPAAEVRPQTDLLKVAAILHDVGKVAISDTILQKPGPLDADERATMQAHTYLGARLFARDDSELDRAAAAVALNHHERWDGTGYPGHLDANTGLPLAGYEDGAPDRARGKRASEIPVFGRVVAVADVYDALSSARCYKPAWPEADVLAELRRSAGTQFDPAMVDALFASLDAIRRIARKYA